MILGEAGRVGEMLVPELGEEVHGLAILCHGCVNVATATGVAIGGSIVLGRVCFLLTQTGEMQVWSRTNNVLGEFHNIFTTCATLAKPPVLEWEQDVVETWEDTDDRAVVDHVFQLSDDAADIFALIEEADALGIGHLGNHVEGKALEPAAHIDRVHIAALVYAALGELLEEDIADLVDVGLIVYDCRHAVHGIDIAAVGGVTLGIPVREEGPLLVVRAAECFVAVGFGELMAASVDHFGGSGVLNAVAVRSISHNGAFSEGLLVTDHQ